MKLIEKIQNVLENKSELQKPILDIHFDDKNNVIGYVSDAVFEHKTDEESQKLIWGTLKKYLGDEELLNISSIFHETPKERVTRLMKDSVNTVCINYYWKHITPEGAKYWLFLGVDKFGTDYKSFFLIINAKDNFKKGITFNYSEDVIRFMELNDSEIVEELFSTAFNNAESEIQLDLMKKYDTLKNEQKLVGRENPYRYVFDRFEMDSVSKRQLIFTDKEVTMLASFLTNFDGFSTKKEIEKAIEVSKVFNAKKVEL